MLLPCGAMITTFRLPTVLMELVEFTQFAPLGAWDSCTAQRTDAAGQVRIRFPSDSLWMLKCICSTIAEKLFVTLALPSLTIVTNSLVLPNTSASGVHVMIPSVLITALRMALLSPSLVALRE